MTKQKTNKGKLPFQETAEVKKTNLSRYNLRLAAIITAATALCVAGCDDSADSDQDTTEYKTTQPVLRFTTMPDGTQTVKQEDVSADLPDPVARQVEKDQTGARWIKIYNNPVPFEDTTKGMTKDTTGLLREYVYVNLDNNKVVPSDSFENEHHTLQQTSDTVYWHGATPYAFDGFWSDKPALNKDEAMQIHEQNINAFAAINAHDTAHHGASGDWTTDTVQSNPVHTNNGGSGHYIFMRSYYPYAYHDYASSPLSSSSGFAKGANASGSHVNSNNRFSTLNLFKSRAFSMTRPMMSRTVHFNTVRTPVVRGFFRSSGIHFGS